MYRVIERVPMDAQTIENLPDWTLGPGLLVTLDTMHPEKSMLVESDSTVRVHRPDGTFLDCKVTGVGFAGYGAKTKQNVSLFFPILNSQDIPISSHIQPFPAVVPEPTAR